jgi:hypothetical protein
LLGDVVHIAKREHSGLTLSGGHKEIHVAYSGRCNVRSQWTTSKVLYKLESRVENMFSS